MLKEEILKNYQLFSLGKTNNTDKIHSGGSIESYLKVYEYFFR